MTRKRIGILGGTFDPIHVGHLALARAARDALALDEVRFVPTGQSWQKGQVVAGAAQRLEMVRLTLAGEPGLVVDAREAQRDGPSYTVDTLAELRRELGPGRRWCWCWAATSCTTCPPGTAGTNCSSLHTWPAPSASASA